MEPGSARRSSSPGSSRLDDGERVRAERVRLLRSLGRSRELSAALEKDAGALQGEARLAVLAEHATLLEGAGEAEKALDVRLMALAEFPGAPIVLDDARRRLDATGRAAESLALATAALDHTTDLPRRRQLLRDVASLTENAAGVDRTGAAEAWLAVLEVDPADAQAAAAAERFLVATGDWERCAELLAWLAARAPTLPPEPSESGAPSRTALLWRLAELRRARLGQIDEALRLYVELGAASKSTLPPLADPPALAAFVRREPLLAVETARAVAAPTAAERSRALLDRARAFAERGRRDDAERDALAAIDFDPHNMEALGALEKFFEEPPRARLLVDELGRRAVKVDPSAAASLYYGRGRAAARAGDNGTARESYRRAMSLDSDAGGADRGARRARFEGGGLVGGRQASRERGGADDVIGAQRGPLAGAGGGAGRSARFARPRGRAARRRRPAPARRAAGAGSAGPLQPRRRELAGRRGGARSAGRPQRRDPRRGRALLRDRRRGRSGRRGRSRADPLLAFLFARRRVPPDVGAALGDSVFSAASGTTPGRRPRPCSTVTAPPSSQGHARRCWCGRRSPICTWGSGSRRSPSWARS